jgi:SAM-dependent methyltransferase
MAWYDELFASEDPMRLDADYYAECEAGRTEVDFVVEKLDLQPGARILDLCCGQGRHLLELTRRGYDVLGFDISAYMLESLREIAVKEGIQPSLVQGNMRDLSFDSQFDAVINMRSSFGYLEDEDEDQMALDGVCRALKPGGRFLTDQINRDSLMRRYKEQFWVRNSRGDIVVADSTFDVRTGRNIVRETAFHADGSRSETNHDIRLYTCREFEDKLIRAGMRIESVWGDWDSSPFDLDHKHMLIIALKGGMQNG